VTARHPRVLPGSEDPFEWQWESFDPETTGMPTVVNGTDCYGGIPVQRCFLGPLAAMSFETMGVSGGVLRSTS